MTRLICPQEINPGCGYCSVPSTFGYVKSRNLDNILSEVKKLVDLGTQKIVLSAPDFLDYSRELLSKDEILTTPCFPVSNYEYIESLLSKLADFEVYFTIENIKACLFDDKVASIISKYVPDSTLHIGCDTADEVHAIEIGRPYGPSVVQKALRIAKKYSLKSNVYFIHGLPNQNAKTTQKTLKFLEENAKYVDKYTIYRFTPLPMSAFSDQPRAKPLNIDKYSKHIFDRIKAINTQKKAELIGKNEVAYVAESYFYNKNDFIAYPVVDGPLILIRNSKKYFKHKIEVEITDIVSDRLVEGKVIRCLD